MKTGIKKQDLLCISDLHIPYQLSYKKLEEFIGVDTLVINGDILDCYQLSSFDKTYRKDFYEELVDAHKYLIKLLDYLKPNKIIITKGNHECRMERYLAKNVDTSIAAIINPDPLSMLFNEGFTVYNRETGSRLSYPALREVYNIEYNGNWYENYNGVIFVHPLSYRSAILGTTLRANDYFIEIGEKFNVVCMSHTHKIACTVVGNKVLLEQGAFMNISKATYNQGRMVKPQTSGCVYMVFNNNKTDFNNIRVIKC